MTGAQRRALARVAKAPHIVNPFSGRKDRWYRITHADMRALRELVKEAYRGDK